MCLYSNNICECTIKPTVVIENKNILHKNSCIKIVYLL